MRLVARSRPWQAACVGLALADLVQRYGAEPDGFQRLSLKLDIGDYAFANDWVVADDKSRRTNWARLEDEITQIKKKSACLDKSLRRAGAVRRASR